MSEDRNEHPSENTSLASPVEGGAAVRARVANGDPLSDFAADFGGTLGEESETIVQLNNPLSSAEYAVPDIPPPPSYERGDGPEVTSAPAPGEDVPEHDPEQDDANEESAEAGAAAETGLEGDAAEEEADAEADADADASANADAAAPEVEDEPTAQAPAIAEAEEDVAAPGVRARGDQAGEGEEEGGEKAFPEPPSRLLEGREQLAPQPQRDILFGELARLEGLATAEQVTEALRIQGRLLMDKGRRRKIGKIMVKLGYLTTIQAKYILRLQRTEDPIVGYKLLERRGQGGMGVVYRAVQKSLKREVALKILSPRFASQKRFLRRFFREAKLAGELNHANLVSAIDFGESNGYYYIAMEFVDGWSVSEMLHEDGPFDQEEALDVVLQVARGLRHAADKHIVHRDVKPENILVTPDGIAKLTDLGLSKQLTSDCSITVEGKTLGTPFYVSPELARGARDVDARSDIYSLGASLYHMLVGEPPFTGDNPAAIMACHIAEEPTPIRKAAPHVTRPVQKLIGRMMEKDAERRYQSAEELIRDVTAIQKGKNPFASTRGPAPDTGSGRHRPVGVRISNSRIPVPSSRRIPNPVDERDRRSAPKAGSNSALIVVLVVVVLVGSLVAVVATQLSNEHSGPRAVGRSAPEDAEIAEGRLRVTTEEVRGLLDRAVHDRTLYNQALEKARTLVARTRGTSVATGAQQLLGVVEREATEGAFQALRLAKEALEDGKPRLALDHLDTVPDVEDSDVLRRVNDLRGAATRLTGGDG